MWFRGFCDAGKHFGLWFSLCQSTYYVILWQFLHARDIFFENSRHGGATEPKTRFWLVWPRGAEVSTRGPKSAFLVCPVTCKRHFWTLWACASPRECCHTPWGRHKNNVCTGRKQVILARFWCFSTCSDELTMWFMAYWKAQGMYFRFPMPPGHFCSFRLFLEKQKKILH